MDNEKQPQAERKYNVVAIVAFLMMWFPLVGPILGIVALFQISKTKEKGKWMAILSIILPIISTILIGVAIYLFITSAIKNTNEKASRLGISSSEYNQINNAINGNCNIEALETGAYISDFSNTKSSNIDYVEDGFATGSRECYSPTGNKVYIAKQENKSNKNSVWRIIFVDYPSNNPPCSLEQDYGVPSSMLKNCDLNNSSTPVIAI